MISFKTERQPHKATSLFNPLNQILKGKGIGLTYCEKIVYMHQGEIWVESEIGAGTIFYFTKPV